MIEPSFHSVTVTGDEFGRIVTTTDMQDVTKDPAFLGEPPVRKADGLSGVDFCSFCPRPWFGHQLDGVAVSGRVAHRFDLSPTGGYWSDELEAFQS